MAGIGDRDTLTCQLVRQRWSTWHGRSIHRCRGEVLAFHVNASLSRSHFGYRPELMVGPASMIIPWQS